MCPSWIGLTYSIFIFYIISPPNHRNNTHHGLHIFYCFSSHLFADILNKIFKKKIKRNKAGGADEDEEEEEEDDDDEDDEDEEEVEDYCPAGCDRALYDRCAHPTHITTITIVTHIPPRSFTL